MNCGSGVVHAEGGATEIGQTVQGFQIWINVPAERKMDDPGYGTVPTEELPLIDVSEGVKARVIAGEAFNKKGPFATVQAVQMIDFELQKGSSGCVDITDDFDTAMLYVYEGSLTVNSEDVSAGQIVLFDADSAEQRGMELSTTEREAKAILFPFCRQETTRTNCLAWSNCNEYAATDP